MKTSVLAAALVLTVAYSATAAAAAHRFKVYGEAYGYTVEDAIDFAARRAFDTCYRTWGESGQEVTVLEQYLDPATGYWNARVSLDCTVYD